MFSIPTSENKMLDFDDFEMSPNLVLFDFDNIAPSSSGFLLPNRQSPRHNNTQSPIQNQSPRYKASSLIYGRLSQLNGVPFVDICAKDFEPLVGGQSSSGSKRKLLEASPKETKPKKRGGTS